MKRWRHLLLAAWLALAFVAGQQLVLLHALGHATDRIADREKDKDAAATCKLHFACSQLASIVGAKPPPAIPGSLAVHVAPSFRELPRGADNVFVFLSRGPPRTSA